MSQRESSAMPESAAASAVPVRGRRLGVDVGKVRVGVAITDPLCVLATPVVTLHRDYKHRDIHQLRRIVREKQVVEVIVGLPRLLSGAEGASAKFAREYARHLTKAIAPVPVRFSDERFTTTIASMQLARAGVRGEEKRDVVDQAAAVEILQSWCDAHRHLREE